MQLSPHYDRPDSESGFVLLAVIFMTVVLLIALAVAAPKVAQSIQRQKDLETIHRGEQYRRAIQLYYRQFNRYPTSVKELMDTNNMRFLRKEYKDPLTGKVDWKPVYYGEAHVRPLGFFGKPLSAVGMTGAASAIMGGPSAGMYAVTSTTTKDGTSGSSDDGLSGGSDDAFGSSDSGSSSAFGSSSTSDSGTFSMGETAGGTGLGSTTSSPAGTSSLASGSTSATGTGSTSSTGSSDSIFGSDATSFTGGGRPIVGFRPPLNKASIVIFMKQTNYSHWEFNYDPIVDQLQAPNLLGGGGDVSGGNDATTANSFGGDDDSSGKKTDSTESTSSDSSTSPGNSSPDIFGSSGDSSSSPIGPQ